MPTYVSLMSWTDQGVRTVRDTVHRREQADALAQKYGASIEQVYWTVGPYDLVAVVQAPDDESATAADFFRLEDGKIVEHWDVLQPVPESAANDHPMF